MNTCQTSSRAPVLASGLARRVHRHGYIPSIACGLLLATVPACFHDDGAFADDEIEISEDGDGDGNGNGDGDCATDESEPHDSESTAEPLSATIISDCDGSGGTVHGTIAGTGDTDWYYYQGDDTTWCYVEPTQSVSQSEDGIRVCTYVECLSGNPDFSCPGGTTADTSPEGRPGCCSDNGGFQIQLDCAGSVDASPVVFIRIDQPEATSDTCNEYSLAYDL